MLQLCIVIIGIERNLPRCFSSDDAVQGENREQRDATRTPHAIPCPEATDLEPDYHPCTKTNRRAVLLITILGSSLAFMDGSIGNVAWSTLQRAFHAGASSVQCVVKATHSSLPHFSCSVELLATNLAERRSSCWAWRNRSLPSHFAIHCGAQALGIMRAAARFVVRASMKTSVFSGLSLLAASCRVLLK